MPMGTDMTRGRHRGYGNLNFDDAPAGGWNISTAVFLQNFSVVAQDTLPSGVFFKPDGTKMYVSGITNDRVYEYNLGTAWDISTAVFLQFFSVAAQDSVPNGVSFKPDGTKMYISGNTNFRVYEYNLGTAWDISTAVFLQFFSVAAQTVSVQDVQFKPDGMKMYVLDGMGIGALEYNLGTAWDISTAVFLQGFALLAAPLGFFFKPDGSKMYVTTDVNNQASEYDLGIAWDVSSAAFLQAINTGAQDGNMTGIYFSPDGIHLYLSGRANDRVYQFDVTD